MPIRLQGHHPHASAQGLPARCPLWSRGWYPWASLPDVQSEVMGGTPGPPCLVSTLESWVVPVGHLAWCPLWNHGHLARWRLGVT